MDRRRFGRLAKHHDLIPVVRELLLDEDTPVSAYRRLSRGGPGFLLESVAGGETWGRYSLLGAAPRGRLRAWGEQVRLEWGGRTRRWRCSDPLVGVERWMSSFRVAAIEGLPRFFGGAVGRLDYEVVRRLQSIPGLPPSAGGSRPDVDLMLVTDLVVFDNLRHTVQLVVCALVDDDVSMAWKDAQERLDSLERALHSPPPPSERISHAFRGWKSSTARRRFETGVRKAQEHIRAGDIFQVVLSHELRCQLGAPPFDVYRAMRCINPSPYMFYLDDGATQILGASPEVLVRVQGNEAVVRPIAGTRRRGADEAEDRARIDDLLSDEKERAEHVMLVDLGRNDLGRVCRYGSVRTREFLQVERYSHVIHLVSHVEGELADRYDRFDALRAAFPAGTVSGAPKVRAMQIIDEIESRPRGIYAGAVGYFGFGGSMDTCIAIRTLECEDGRARLGVGAGVVLDSVPRREWEETHEKAGAAQAAVDMAERGLVP
jgi:anthranilate synthase component 1